uniref:Glutathione peroxidase n=1 Tax=Tetraselmis sp. GSL018 TaxID=582737 RepID=A0A061S0G7_9CHLO|mmetsp:Transcript_42265/g.100267  ORF Transcript_42265/g.100267 Transcript_42265/m.100267 type:complete len:91 (+) Transcript_42265:347-619(+)
MGQEPGTNDEIKAFATNKGFPGVLMDKIDVNGKNSSPVFSWLKYASKKEGAIQWNFEKFLVKKNGEVAGRYGPRTNPVSILPDIEKALAE